ncbi:tail fiber protein [Massilia sp. W12]|uniref:phage tail protein n=1 Tax=Massilia sp. W12 TaxID=3126507 RepID=UPI0030CCA9CC
MEAFIGTILAVGFDYPPRGWVFCNGQLMNISNNSALFALFGTRYGGDGRVTFGIPDCRGRTIVGSQAQGPGLQNVVQGQLAGTNNVSPIATGSTNFTLSVNNLPSHTHTATSTLAVSMSGLSGSTTISVGTATSGGATVAAANSTLTSTVGSPPTAASAAIYLPAGTAQTNPVTLGGVTTTVSGTPSLTGGITNSNTGLGQAVTAPVAIVVNPISIMQPYIGLNYICATEGIFPSRN